MFDIAAFLHTTVCIAFLTELSACFILTTGFGVILDKLKHKSVIKNLDGNVSFKVAWQSSSTRWPCL